MAGERALETGRDGEVRARRELEALGWRTLDVNVTFRGGELDLVMEDGATVVFVEVRHRSRATFGDAAASLGARKQARVRRAAALWLVRHARHDDSVRFDAVLLDGHGPAARLTHLRDAF
ncbi:MAG: YraN family protein [Trueperaceae bacterium]|nr:YraN family protein [Trueperaceae bacterium]